MRNAALIFLLSIIFITSINAQSQKIELGIVAGLNFSNLYGNKIIDSLSKTKASISQGVSFQYNINSRFSINSKLLFERKGYRAKIKIPITDEVGNSMGINDIRITNNMDYISLPITARAYFGKQVKVFFSAGPYFSYLIKQLEYQTMTYSENGWSQSYVFNYINQFNRLDIGLSGGAGVFIPFTNKIGMTIEAGHNLGLTNISKSGKLKNSSSFALLGINYKL